MKKTNDAFDTAPYCGNAARAILVRQALQSTLEPRNLTGVLETCRDMKMAETLSHHIQVPWIINLNVKLRRHGTRRSFIHCSLISVRFVTHMLHDVVSLGLSPEANVSLHCRGQERGDGTSQVAPMLMAAGL